MPVTREEVRRLGEPETQPSNTGTAETMSVVALWVVVILMVILVVILVVVVVCDR